MRIERLHENMSNYWRGKEIIIDFSHVPKRKGLRHFRRDFFRELKMITTELWRVLFRRKTRRICSRSCHLLNRQAREAREAYIRERSKSLPMIIEEDNSKIFGFILFGHFFLTR